MKSGSEVIRAKAPLRLSFAGGGTDVPPFPENEGGFVLSATIDRAAFASLSPRDDRAVTVTSHDLGREASFQVGDQIHFDGNLDLAKAAVRRVIDKEAGGFDVTLRSSAPPGSGLGASSAVVVALIGAMQAHYRTPLTSYEIAELAYLVERQDLGIAGGLQDQYAATFGGFNFIEFHADHVVVNPLRIDDETVRELEHNLLLVDTGRTRMSDHIIADQTSRYLGGEPGAIDALRRQKQLAVAMKNALLQRRPRVFGELLDEAWHEKRRMSPRIATGYIDDAYEAAKKAGAIGGKVTGAGGGGYMLFYLGEGTRPLVTESLVNLGLTVTDFGFSRQGLTTWRAWP